MVTASTTYTFQDLAVHYGTGRSYVKSGTGKDRVYGYRVGKKCNAGDIEASEWRQLVKAAIDVAGEQELYRQLFDFMKQRDYCRRTKSDLEDYVLELHASRIFDNEAWVLYVEFNQMYRPEALNPDHLRWVETECCKQKGQVTLAMLDRPGREPGTVPCPICGKHSAYVFIRQSA